jgi:hypothetical protein
MYVLSVAALEIGLIPTSSFEAECGRTQDLFQRRLTALGTLDEWRVTHLLQYLKLVATGLTTIFVDWHVSSTLMITDGATDGVAGNDNLAILPHGVWE